MIADMLEVRWLSIRTHVYYSTTDAIKQGTIATDLFHRSSQRWHFKRLLGGPDVSTIDWCITHQLLNRRRRTGSHRCGRASRRWRPPTTVGQSRRSGVSQSVNFASISFKVEWICNTAGISSKPTEHATRMSPITRRQRFETSSVGNGKMKPYLPESGQFFEPTTRVAFSAFQPQQIWSCQQAST